jgi:hypothetical protein
MQNTLESDSSDLRLGKNLEKKSEKNALKFMAKSRL